MAGPTLGVNFSLAESWSNCLREVEGLGFGEASGELSYGLSGDADGLDFGAGGLELRFGRAEGAEGFGDLRLPGVAVEADKGGDGADLWLLGLRGRGGGYSEGEREGQEEGDDPGHAGSSHAGTLRELLCMRMTQCSRLPGMREWKGEDIEDWVAGDGGGARRM